MGAIQVGYTDQFDGLINVINYYANEQDDEVLKKLGEDIRTELEGHLSSGAPSGMSSL